MTKNYKSLFFLSLIFLYAIHFGLFPLNFPEYTKCEKKDLLRKGWKLVVSEVPRAKPIVTNNCLIRIGNLQYLKATDRHFKKIIEIRSTFIEPADYLPSVKNKVI